MNHIASLIVGASIALNAPTSLAWGERGHDLVTRVAVQNLRLVSDNNPKIMQPFLARDHMLSHLSNVPDIVWRAPYMSDKARRDNGPTHYIGLENVYNSPQTIDDLDLSFSAFTARIKAQTNGPTYKVGTAPWRIKQLYSLMVANLKKAKASKDAKAIIDATNRALLHAGLMSHFVGDLANPHHATVNHNGQLTGNNGLHNYFEGEVVSELSFRLIEQIYQRSDTALRLLLEPYNDVQRQEVSSHPHKLVLALALNSNQNLEKLMELDNRFSLLKKSTEEDEDALRKPAAEVTDEYQAFIVERLAIGSAVLAQLWHLAWLEAGEPDLSSFKSWWYPVQPEFIELDYQ